MHPRRCARRCASRRRRCGGRGRCERGDGSADWRGRAAGGGRGRRRMRAAEISVHEAAVSYLAEVMVERDPLLASRLPDTYLIVTRWNEGAGRTEAEVLD